MSVVGRFDASAAFVPFKGHANRNATQFVLVNGVFIGCRPLRHDGIYGYCNVSQISPTIGRWSGSSRNK